MKILADENVDGPLVAYLRSVGHDVTWMAEADPGREDDEVLALAREQQRVIVTQDRHFGDLVFRDRHGAAGVIYLRLRSRSLVELLERFQRAWPEVESRAIGHYVVVSRGRVRVRPLPSEGRPRG